jgi:hypothetical protein
MIKKIKNECSSLQLNMSDEQINELIKISKEDLIESKGTFDEDTHYQLSLSNVKLTWVRFIRQYSNNPLNEIIDVDKIINDETLNVKTLYDKLNMKEIKETTYKGTRILIGNEKRTTTNLMAKYLIEKGYQEISIPVIQYQETFNGKVEEEKHIIETLANIGVPKETTLEIMHELLLNSSNYADNQDAIDTMLQEKLGIDLYITLKQYIKI